MRWNSQIPFYKVTDPSQYPQWTENAPPGQSGSRYPKILQRPCSSADREDWLKRHVRHDTQGNREAYFDEKPPNVGDLIPILSTSETVAEGLAAQTNTPLIAEDQEHETRLWAHVKALVPEPVPIPIARPKRRRRKKTAAANEARAA